MRGGHAAGLSLRRTPLVSPCRRIMWHTVITALHLFILTRTHMDPTVSHILQRTCTLEVRQMVIQNTHMHTQIAPFLECVTHERTSLNAHSVLSALPPPPSSSFFCWSVDPASGLAFSYHLRVRKPADHMGCEGLISPHPPPLEGLLFEGNSGASCHLFCCCWLPAHRMKKLLCDFTFLSPPSRSVWLYLNIGIFHICKQI